MNAILATAYRDLTCAAAAAVITLVLALSFLQATSIPPGMHAPTSAAVAQGEQA
jgi:hypothetical protein